MPRPPRIKFPGAYYHIMSRGTAKQPIFLRDHDRLTFLNTLSDAVNKFSWMCHAYCLMDNHFHLLIATTEPNLSEGMHSLNSKYCHCFNRKYDRVGHLMQGRYLAPLVENESHLLVVARYIVLNPVRSGVTRWPEEWRWSSFLATAGLAPAPRFLEVSFILGLFSDDLNKGREAYITFIEEGIIEGLHDNPDSRVPLQELFKGVRDKNQRDVEIRAAHTEHGYTLKEIAAYLQVSLSTVSRAKKT